MNSIEQNRQILCDDINNLWSLSRFKLPRYPIKIGKTMFKNMEPIDKKEINITDMLIKLPDGSVDFPSYLDTNIKDFIDKCIKYEKNINKTFEGSYVYLTIWYQRLKTQEIPFCMTDDLDTCNMGVHVDGVQGERYEDKQLRACHTYMAVDCIPPLFYYQGFDLEELDLSSRNLHTQLANNAQVEYMVDWNYITNNDIFLYTAYQAHKQLQVETPGLRVIFRLDISEKLFDRRNNTKNLSKDLNYELSYSDRDIPYRLRYKVPTIIDYKAIRKEQRKCSTCEESVYQTYAKKCELCTKKEDWKSTLERGARGHYYQDELINTEIQIWCANRNPKLHFKNFKLHILNTDAVFNEAKYVEFRFYDPNLFTEIKVQIPIEKIKNLMKLKFKGNLNFLMRKRVKALTQGKV